jgi:hypothetical protein
MLSGVVPGSVRLGSSLLLIDLLNPIRPDDDATQSTRCRPGSGVNFRFRT